MAEGFVAMLGLLVCGRRDLGKAAWSKVIGNRMGWWIRGGRESREGAGLIGGRGGGSSGAEQRRSLGKSLPWGGHEGPC